MFNGKRIEQLEGEVTALKIDIADLIREQSALKATVIGLEQVFEPNYDRRKSAKTEKSKKHQSEVMTQYHRSAGYKKRGKK